MASQNPSRIVKPLYFANWADIFGFPIASGLLPFILPFKFITPNVVTITAFILYTIGCFFLFLDYPNHQYIAAFLIFAGYIGDDLDGQLARARGLSSTFGDYLDKVLDVLKIFIITASLSYAVYIQTGDVLFILLGFIACFFFNLRYYIKLETLFSRISSDSDYLEKSASKKTELEKKYDAEKGLRSFWIKNRNLFFVDEAEFVIITAIAALFNRIDLALWILALSQVLIALFRFFERGYQLNNNSENLLKPLRK